MNTILQNNPFSIYDFLGYLFPGFFFVLVMIVIHFSDTLCMDQLFCMMCEEDGILEKVTIVNALFFIIMSYIAGHLLSYLSSLSIERFALWLYGYPSEFLLGQRKAISFWNSKVTTSSTRDDFKCSQCNCCIGSCLVTLLIRFVMGVILSPISLLTILTKLVNLKGFIVKPLDELTCKLTYFKRH